MTALFVPNEFWKLIMENDERRRKYSVFSDSQEAGQEHNCNWNGGRENL